MLATRALRLWMRYGHNFLSVIVTLEIGMAGLERIVTDELVFSIADRLDAEGRKVSNRLV